MIFAMINENGYIFILVYLNEFTPCYTVDVAIKKIQTAIFLETVTLKSTVPALWFWGRLRVSRLCEGVRRSHFLESYGTSCVVRYTSFIVNSCFRDISESFNAKWFRFIDEIYVILLEEGNCSAFKLPAWAIGTC